MSSLVVIKSFVMFGDLKEEKVKVTLIRNNITIFLCYLYILLIISFSFKYQFEQP